MQRCIGGKTPVSAVVLLVVLVFGARPAVAAGERTVFGRIEHVHVARAFTLSAKLDTGADTSSLDARDIKRFRRRGRSMVRFTVIDQETDSSLTLERPLVRIAKIKRHGGAYQRRPVVQVTICLGSVHEQIEINLIDRANFEYPLLLGTSALVGNAVVDPALEFTREPECERQEAGP